jgi:hypothetical protein
MLMVFCTGCDSLVNAFPPVIIVSLADIFLGLPPAVLLAALLVYVRHLGGKANHM